MKRVVLNDDFLEEVFAQCEHNGLHWAEFVDEYNGNGPRSRSMFWESHDKEAVHIDASLIQDGVRKLANAEVNEDIKRTIYRAIEHDDPGELDSECVDVIIQLGQYMEVVYG